MRGGGSKRRAASVSAGRRRIFVRFLGLVFVPWHSPAHWSDVRVAVSQQRRARAQHEFVDRDESDSAGADRTFRRPISSYARCC